MKKVIWISTIWALTLTATTLTGQENARPTDAVRFVFLGDTRPVLIEVQTEIDGRPARAAWSDYLRRWFDLLDRDHDGTLDASEVQIAPTDDVMVQAMRQGFYFNRPGTPAPRMQANGAAVSFADFLCYYERKCGPYQLGNALQVNNTSSVLLQQKLDRNNDKVLTRTELAGAADLLDALDKSDDEILTADELGSLSQANLYANQIIINNGRLPAQTTGSDSFLYIDDSTLGKMALLLLTQYDRNGDKALQQNEASLETAAFTKLDTNRDGKLDVEELAQFHERPADAKLIGRIGPTGEKQGPTSAENAGNFDIRETAGGMLARIGDAEITFKVETDNQGMMASRNQFFLQQFKLVDKANQKFIEKAALMNNQAAILGQIFAITDANGDGKMTEDELTTFLKLQDDGKNAFATVSVVEQGRAFFQILDANRDNRLSLRELRSAWSQLEAYDADKDGAIGSNEVARQFQLNISRGQNVGFTRAVLVNPGMAAANVPPAASRNAPLWFRKMDQNNDGDVSPREFLGTPEQFERIDHDRDGLISPTEAATLRD